MNHVWKVNTDNVKIVEVKSTDGKRTYTVTAIDGVCGCTCPAHQYRKTCKHSAALALLVEHCKKEKAAQ